MTSQQNATPHQRAQFVRLFDDLVEEERQQGRGKGAKATIAAALGLHHATINRLRNDHQPSPQNLSRDKLVAATATFGFAFKYFDDQTGRSYRDFKADLRQPLPAPEHEMSLAQVAEIAERVRMAAGDPVLMVRLAGPLAEGVLALDIVQRAQRILLSQDPNDRSADAYAIALKLHSLLAEATRVPKKK